MNQLFLQDEITSHRLIPGLTPNHILSELAQLPLVRTQLRKNSEDLQQRFIEVMSRLPSKSDHPGYIYGFRTKSSYNSKDPKYEIKMGRTKREVPQQRIFEWEKDDMHEYVQIFTVRSEFNVKLEALVHLVFAHARKTIVINGKRRVEWFQFSEKVATAAIANLLNLLMEKIHEKYIDRLEKIQQIHNSPYYSQLLELLLSRCRLSKGEFAIAAFGLPRAGKSTFASVLAEDEINVFLEKKRLKLIERKRPKPGPVLLPVIEISTLQQPLTEHKQFAYYFQNCLKLCSSKIFPVLVMKQSDIESSTLVGATQALVLFEKYAKLQQDMTIVVTKARKNYCKDDVLQTIAQHEKIVNKKYIDLLQKSEYIFIREPQSQGLFISTGETLKMKTKLMQLMSQQKWAKLQLNLEKHLLPLCYQIIQKSYELLPQIYADQFLKVYLQHIEEQDKVELLTSLYNTGRAIKQPQNQNQLGCFMLVSQLLELLQLSERYRVQSYLYIFCEICANKTIVSSTIFDGMVERMNEKMVQITDTHNRKLADSLQTFKKSIVGYIQHSKNLDYMPLLKQIMQASKFEEMKTIMLRIADSARDSEKQTTAQMATTFTSLLEAVQVILGYTQRGLRFDSVDGRIRQAVYYAIKNDMAFEDIKQVRPFEPVKEAQDAINECTTNANRLSELIKRLKDFKQGLTILNFSEEISFDIPTKISLKHNLFIFSKCVRVNTSADFSFSGYINEHNERRKLKLMIVTEKFINGQKIAIPCKSANGDGYGLYIAGEEITCLYPEGKKIAEIRDTFDDLKKVYRAKIK